MSYSLGMEQNKYQWRSTRSKEPRRSNAKNHRVQKPNDKLIQGDIFDLTKGGYQNFIDKIRETSTMKEATPEALPPPPAIVPLNFIPAKVPNRAPMASGSGGGAGFIQIPKLHEKVCRSVLKKHLNGF